LEKDDKDARHFYTISIFQYRGKELSIGDVVHITYFILHNYLKPCFLLYTASVDDPDPHGFLAGWIRIRFGSADPVNKIRKGKNDPQK
jgi:hypothetical protein